MKNVILNNKFLRTLVLTSSLVLSTFSANADVILSFSESDLEVGLNDTFTMDLYATTETDSNAFLTFFSDLTFDSGILSLDAVNVGSSFIAGTDIAGTYFGTSLLDLTASGNDILLASLTFTAIDYGMTSLETISESFASLSPFITIGSESASANISVVSAPATLGLFAIALAGLVSLRRKA